jgi:hypothetical protein
MFVDYGLFYLLAFTFFGMFLIVGREFPESWLVGFTAVVSYVAVDLMLHFVIIEEKDGHYHTPIGRMSLDPRRRLYAVLAFFILFGSLLATIVAYATLIPLAVVSGNSWPWIVLGGSGIAAVSVWLDLRLVYPLIPHTQPMNPQ